MQACAASGGSPPRTPRLIGGTPLCHAGVCRLGRLTLRTPRSHSGALATARESPAMDAPWCDSVFVGDRIVAVADATISILDRGLLRGEGVFEALRTYGGKPFCVSRHLDRMIASARTADVSLPERSLLERAIAETAE